MKNTHAKIIIAISYFLLFILALLPRMYALGTIPTALSHDEVDVIIQAHSIRLTGRDLSGSWSPLTLVPNDGLMAELSGAINLPALAVLPNTLFAAHFTTALLGSLYPILIVTLLISWGLNKKASWLSGVLLALSPWHLLFSRTSLEQPASLFFYTLSWIFLTKIYANKNNLKALLISLISFATFYTLGFYTYHGYKFSLPLLTIIIAFYNYFRTLHHHKLVIITIVLTVIGSLYLRTFLNIGSYLGRQSEIVFLDQSVFSKKVDLDRRLSIMPKRLNEFLVNKPLAMLHLAIDKYMSLLSPQQMFMNGENNGVFSTGRTGYLYVFLLPFVLIGVVCMVISGKKTETFISLLVFISPIATIIHKNGSFAFRSGIFVVLLTIAGAYGIAYLNSRYPRYRISTLAIVLTFISFIHFSYIYLGYYPVESSRAYFFADSTLATYLSHRGEEKILVIDPQPRYIMSYLVLTNKSVTLDTIRPLIGKYSTNEEQNIYEIDNLTIRRDCPSDNINAYDTVIADFTLIDGLGGCIPLHKLKSSKILIRNIVDPLDGGVIKQIYGDRICENTAVARYVNLSRINTFAINKMSKVQFCSSWIIEN